MLVRAHHTFLSRISGSFLLRNGKLQITEGLFVLQRLLYAGNRQVTRRHVLRSRYMRASPTFILDLRPAQVILIYNLW